MTATPGKGPDFDDPLETRIDWRLGQSDAATAGCLWTFAGLILAAGAAYVIAMFVVESARDDFPIHTTGQRLAVALVYAVWATVAAAGVVGMFGRGRLAHWRRRTARLRSRYVHVDVRLRPSAGPAALLGSSPALLLRTDAGIVLLSRAWRPYVLAVIAVQLTLSVIVVADAPALAILIPWTVAGCLALAAVGRRTDATSLPHAPAARVTRDGRHVLVRPAADPESAGLDLIAADTHAARSCEALLLGLEPPVEVPAPAERQRTAPVRPPQTTAPRAATAEREWPPLPPRPAVDRSAPEPENPFASRIDWRLGQSDALTPALLWMLVSFAVAVLGLPSSAGFVYLLVRGLLGAARPDAAPLSALLAELGLAVALPFGLMRYFAHGPLGWWGRETVRLTKELPHHVGTLHGPVNLLPGIRVRRSRPAIAFPTPLRAVLVTRGWRMGVMVGLLILVALCVIATDAAVLPQPLFWIGLVALGTLAPRILTQELVYFDVDDVTRSGRTIRVRVAGGPLHPGIEFTCGDEARAAAAEPAFRPRPGAPEGDRDLLRFEERYAEDA